MDTNQNYNYLVLDNQKVIYKGTKTACQICLNMLPSYFNIHITDDLRFSTAIVNEDILTRFISMKSYG